MTTQPPDDLMWGAEEIANYIQRPIRTVYYLIDRGVLPVKKLGPRTLVARRSEIDRAFSHDGAPDTKKPASPASNKVRGGAR